MTDIDSSQSDLSEQTQSTIAETFPMKDEFGYWYAHEAGGDAETIRVLHVDDDADFTELAALYLERKSDAFEVVSVNSAQAGIARVADGDIDCIVSDYQMPGQNGLECFTNLPAEQADVPFILFTGKGSEEVASDAFSVGVTDYLQKATGTDQFTVLANRIEQAVSNARSQARVALTRRRFKSLVEEATDAIFVVAPDGTLQYATPACQPILGTPPEALIGTDGFEPVHPEDVDSMREEFFSLVEDPTSHARAEFRYRHADGTWIWVEARGRNLLDNEDIQGIVVYIRDVSARKANEAELERRETRFRAVFEEAFDAMVIVNDDGEYVDVNPAACALFGLEKAAILGRRIRDFAPEEYDFSAAWETFQQSERNRGLFPLVRPDGERRPVEFAATANILPNRHLAILREVTQRDAVDAEGLGQHLGDD